jgi:hypothetical protein
MGHIKFIRKGSGLPFQGGPFDTKEFRAGNLPGVFQNAIGHSVRLDVRTREDGPLFQILDKDTYFGITAGLDREGRPSFLTIEDMDCEMWWGQGIMPFTTTSEYRIEHGMSLEQSECYTSDLIREHYVAQWSLVQDSVRKGLRRTRPIYELSYAYALASYRNEGLMHLCLGELIEVPVLAKVA